MQHVNKKLQPFSPSVKKSTKTPVTIRWRTFPFQYHPNYQAPSNISPLQTRNIDSKFLTIVGNELNGNSLSAAVNKWLTPRVVKGVTELSYGHTRRDLLFEEECPLPMINTISFVNYKNILHIKVCQAVIQIPSGIRALQIKYEFQRRTRLTNIIN